MKPDFFNILAEHGLVDQAEAEAAAAGLSFKKGRVKASELAQALLATAPLDGPELIQLAASLAETEASKCPHLTHHAWFESVVAPHVIRQLSKGANGYARIAYELSDRLRRSKAVMEAVPARWRRRTHYLWWLHTIDMTDEVIATGLRRDLENWCQFSTHEWPRVVLYENDTPSKAECNELRHWAFRLGRLDGGGAASSYWRRCVDLYDEYQRTAGDLEFDEWLGIKYPEEASSSFPGVEQSGTPTTRS